MADTNESARTTLILAVLAIFIGFFVLLYGLQSLIFFQVHYWARGTPFLKAATQPLPSTVSSPIAERGLTFYGIEFAAPWKNITRRIDGDMYSEVDFQPGEVLDFFNPDGEKDIVAGIRSAEPQIFRRFAAIFGRSIFPSNYALYSAVYGATPAAVSPFQTRTETVRKRELLLWKLAFGPSGASAIYALQSGEMHGFQLGDPAHDRYVIVRLFDAHDRQLRILLASKSGQPGTISQADINCVIGSIRPISPAK